MAETHIVDTQPRSSFVNGTLNLLILEAENLKKRDFNKMDPYCVVEFQDYVYKTEPCKKGHLNPKWDQTLEIPIKDVNLSEKVTFKVFDKELIRDNKIGKITLSLQRLADMCKTGEVCELELETFGLLHKGKPAGVLKMKPCFKGSGWPGCDASIGKFDQKVEPVVEPSNKYLAGPDRALVGVAPIPLPIPTQPLGNPDLEQRFADIERQIRAPAIDGWPGAYERTVQPQGFVGKPQGFVGQDFVGQAPMAPQQDFVGKPSPIDGWPGAYQKAITTPSQQAGDLGAFGEHIDKGFVQNIPRDNLGAFGQHVDDQSHVDKDLEQRYQDIAQQQGGQSIDGWPGAYEKSSHLPKYGGGGVLPDQTHLQQGRVRHHEVDV